MADPIPTRGALDALAHAEAMKAQTDPAIWFDSWNNDLRDNNLDRRIDDPLELKLKGSDGLHYKKTYTAQVAPIGLLSIDDAPDWALQTINVVYKVCIDIPIESYHAARVKVSSQRIITNFFRELKHIPGWRVWDGGAKPEKLLDGDVVAANNPVHQHAGIVKAGTVYDSVINLPGPTSARKYHVFTPSGRNDMVEVPFALFDEVLHVDLYARWTRP